MLSKIRKAISHNQGQFVAVLIMAGILIYMIGCNSKVESLLIKDKMVTGDQLQFEFESEADRLELQIENLGKKATMRFTELERQDAMKQRLIDAMLITAESDSINPSGIVGMLFSVFGIGAAIDNRIKDKVIKNRPLPAVKV